MGYSAWSCKESDMTDQLTLSLFSLLISNLNLVNIIFLSALSISVSFGFFSLSINICVHIPKYQKKKKKKIFPMRAWASLVAYLVKNLPAMQEMQVQSLD